MYNIRAVIWDWGRTLFDTENNAEYSSSQEILEYFQAKGWKQIVVSLVTDASSVTLDERQQQIEFSPLKPYFELILVGDENKDDILDEALGYLDISPDQILIVDDRVIRGIKYANKKEMPSVWLQQGKFANELPNAETGQPTFTIKSIEEIKNLF